MLCGAVIVVERFAVHANRSKTSYLDIFVDSWVDGNVIEGLCLAMFLGLELWYCYDFPIG